MRRGRLPAIVLAGAIALAGTGLAAAAPQADAPKAAGPHGLAPRPDYDIWSVRLGKPLTQIPWADVVDVACGTNGGPPSVPLKAFSDFAQCPPEKSGLREIYFKYDDEREYIAKALEIDNPAMAAGTSMYAHPVLVSVLVDKDGLVRGIRVVTDPHASTYQRRTLFDLANNLRSRYAPWKLDCRDLPPADGEMPVGKAFVHKVCTGENAARGERLRIESRYYRRKGEVAVDPTTQQVVPENFHSLTRFELVQLPYRPFVPTTR